MNTLNILVIYIFIWLLPGDADGREIHMNNNITGVLGSNNMELKCSFVKDETDFVLSVTFLAKNSSQFEDIAVFQIIGDKNATLTPFGVYLFGNKILNNITESPTEVVIVFNNLSCKHEREYQCILFVLAGGKPYSTKSNPMTLSVEVPPEKPDTITIDQENGNNNSSKITEGENVTFTCFGNVGRPPGEYYWQKDSTNGIRNYSSFYTSYKNIDESCSNNGTSSLTIRMTADDDQAKMRCIVISKLANETKYQETDPIDVYYKVRKPIISRHPNQQMYDKATQHIRLNCTSKGNPKPSYEWYRNGTLIASASIFVIQNVVVNNSGSYVCRVQNRIEGSLYRETESVNIIISDRTDSLSDMGSTRIYSFIVPVCVAIPVILVVAIICWRRRRSKKKGCLSSYFTGNDNLAMENTDTENNDTKEETATQDNPNIGNQFGCLSSYFTGNDNLAMENTDIENNDTKEETATQDNPNIGNHVGPPSRCDLYASVKKQTQCQHENKTDKSQSRTDDGTYADLNDGVYDKLGDTRHIPTQNIQENNYDTMDNVVGDKDNLKEFPEIAPGYENITEETAVNSAPAETFKALVRSSQQPDALVIVSLDETHDTKGTYDYENMSKPNLNDTLQ